MSRHPLDRAALLIGLGAVLSTLFTFGTGPDDHFVAVRGAAVVLLPVVGLVAVLGAITGRALLVVAAGAVYAVAAVLQLVQLGHATNWLNGNGSTMSLHYGLALGLLVVGVARKRVPATEPSDQEPTGHRTA